METSSTASPGVEQPSGSPETVTEPIEQIRQAAQAVGQRGLKPPPGGFGKLFQAWLALKVTSVLLFVYLVLVVGGLVCLGYHAATKTALLEQGGEGLLSYALPLLGIPVLFVLLLPFLTRAEKKPAPPAIARGKEPELYRCVELLCKALNAPAPTVISIGVRRNASAKVRGGSLHLSIGMPLFAGLAASQMAGIIANEVTFFRKGGVFALRRGSFCLQEKLEQWGTQKAPMSFLIARLPLCLLSKVAAALNKPLRRQMQLDRDWMDAQVEGEKNFTATAYQLWRMEQAVPAAEQFLSECQQDGVLPDDWTQLLQAHLPKSDTEHEEAFRAEPAHGGHSHVVSMRERLKAVESAGFEPAFTCDQPARYLLQEPGERSREATRLHYENDRAFDLGSFTLHPTRTLLMERREYEIVERYYEATWSQAYILFTLGVAMPTDFSEWAASGEVDHHKLAHAWLRFRAEHPREVERTDAYERTLAERCSANKLLLLRQSKIAPGDGFGDMQQMSEEELLQFLAEEEEKMSEFAEGELAELHHTRARILAMICVSALGMVPENQRPAAENRMRLGAAALRKLAERRPECENLLVAVSVARMTLESKGSIPSHLFEKLAQGALEKMEAALEPFYEILKGTPTPIWLEFDGDAASFLRATPLPKEGEPVQRELQRRVDVYERLASLMNFALTDVARVVGPWLIRFDPKNTGV